MIAELERIRLLKARPEDGLPVGAEGTVVLAYPGGRHYEVEFGETAKHGSALCMIAADELAPIRPRRRRASSPSNASVADPAPRT